MSRTGRLGYRAVGFEMGTGPFEGPGESLTVKL
jgi:hypothetical protein